jgi:fumarate reductase flavoprotein subunit
MQNSIRADVVVVGAGGSGMAAAVQAAEKGVKTVLLEHRGSIGGNASLANGIFAVETSVQRHNMIDADKDKVYRDVMMWNRYSTMVNPRIVRKWINRTADTVEWLIKMGVEFEVGTRMRLHYHQDPFWHVVKGDAKLGRFNAALKALKAAYERLGVEILYKCEPREILVENGETKGILVKVNGEETIVQAPAVIMCTGGFMGNAEWLKRYFPFYDPAVFGGIVVPYKGEGIEMVRRAGGAMSDRCTLVREACMTFAKNKDITASVRQPFCIWVNREGRRFVEESAAAHSQMVSNALIRQPGAVAWCIYDSALVNEVEEKGYLLPHGPNCEEPSNLRQLLEDAVAETGDAVLKGSSIPELAEKIGCETSTLEGTIASSNVFFEKGYDEEFAKERRFLRSYRQPPFYAIKFSVLTVETIGPVLVSEDMEVLDDRNLPIPGLYSAGVMTCGWMAEDYCGDYLFGANLSYSLNSGRFAAESAVRYVQNHTKVTT